MIGHFCTFKCESSQSGRATVTRKHTVHVDSFIMAPSSGRSVPVANLKRYCCSNRACIQWLRTYNPLRRLLVYMAIIVVYVLLGAWIFSVVESPNETEQIAAAKAELKALKRALSILVRHNQTALSELTGLVEDICSLGAFKDQQRLWDYTPSLLFTTTVVTTIGIYMHTLRMHADSL